MQNKDEISTLACHWPSNTFPVILDPSTADSPLAFFSISFSSHTPRQTQDICDEPDVMDLQFASMPFLCRKATSNPQRGVRDTQSAVIVSLNSTPLRPSPQAIPIRAGAIKSTTHDEWVKQHFRDKIIWDFDPAEFIEAVWGHPDIRKQPFRGPGRPGKDPNTYKLNKKPLETWIRQKDERKSYVPLAELANGLSDQLYGSDSSSDRIHRDLPARFMIHDRKYNGGCTEEKVDLVYSAVPRVGNPQWDLEATWIEVKKLIFTPDYKVPNAEMITQKDIEAAKRKRSSDEIGDTPAPKRPHTPTQRGGEEGERDAGSKNEQAGRADGVEETPSERIENREQPGQQADGTFKPSNARDLTSNEAQAVRYMNNLMSSNVRSFGIGWLIEDDDLRLWYGDRMGLVVTKKFKWLADGRGLFLLCVAAMGQAGVHGMGVFPDLRFPKGEDGETVFRNYEDAWLSTRAQRPDVQELEELEFDIETGNGRIYTEFGVLGRGTSVLPIVARPETKAHELFKDEKLVAKVSWPHAMRRAEDSLITAVRQTLKEKKPQYLPHVVELKCSVTRTIAEMNMPRNAMGLFPEQADECVCRMLVLKCYERLEMIESVEDFKTVFIDVVRAHHWVWVTSPILHRDISTNNVMWHRIGNKVYGVLCDWDLAEQQVRGNIPSTRAGEAPVAEESHSSTTNDESTGTAEQPDTEEGRSDEPSQKSRYRTGTGPFMAMDLLRPGPAPYHLYRYDLESFFYLLVYVCAVLDLQKKKFGHLTEWERKTLVEIGDNKLRFLTYLAVYKSIFANCDPAFRPLAENTQDWVCRLWIYFRQIETLASRILELQALVSLGISLDEGQDELKQLEGKRDSVIDYAKFMAVLGAPEDIPDVNAI